MDPNDFRYPCNGKQSALDVQSLANNPELLSATWATVEGLGSNKFCSNRLLQVTKNLRGIDKKIQCFRELLQQDVCLLLSQQVSSFECLHQPGSHSVSYHMREW
ncbi:fdhD: FdhD [Crotalus adamanteus]|uniref:FdhD: FdhD n=1 Tax=Crotalus adamanteus TaxID=8729 RepID=A0AAW1BZ56_CROAD